MISNSQPSPPLFRELCEIKLQFQTLGITVDYLDFDRTAYLLYSTNAAASAHTKI